MRTAQDGQIGQLKQHLEEARQTARSSRVAELREQVKEVLSETGDRTNAAVYLFGSWATGRFDGASDTDLLVIAPTRQEAEAVQGRLMVFADDVIAYAAGTWASRCERGDPFVRRVASERILLAEVGDGAYGGDRKSVV